MLEYSYMLIADTHFGDKKAIKNYGRPPDHEKLLERSLLDLKENSLLLHLGDICTENDLYWHEQCIRRIKCKKILIKGNLDRQSYSWYLDHGWDAVFESIELHVFGKTIICSHIPKVVPCDTINIHGHMHNLDTSSTLPSNYICVSSELTQYSPVDLISVIESHINK